MIGLLARVVIGVAFAGVAGATVYGIYKCLTPDTAKSEIKEKVQDSPAFKEAFKAKYKERSENGETFTFEVMDQWDEPLGDVDLYADDISGDIEIGDEIILVG